MKKCFKSGTEPECLTSYRDAHPQGIWDEFRGNRTCYQIVREAARRDQGGLCAYCERLLPNNDQQVAHFHPKSDHGGGVNWALHWPNLWFACCGGDQATRTNPDSYLPPTIENRSCDVAKENAVVDGQVFSPSRIPAFPRVFRYEQSPDRMDIVPDEENCRVEGVDVSLAEATVKTFNLNCRRLSEARMRVHRAIEGQIRRLRGRSDRSQELYRILAERLLARRADGNWNEFFTMIRWRFRETSEEYLQSIGYDG